jgi:NADPH-dependent ferric siderophore reductase
LFEYKGEQYTWLLTFSESKESTAQDLLEQSARQIAASGGRPIVWIFAEEEAALIARKLLDNAKGDGSVS